MTRSSAELLLAEQLRQAGKAVADLADVRRQEQEEWTLKCGKCGVLKRKHPAGGDHPFEVAA